MIDFACVSSTTPTWSNDPRWCTPGIAATEAEHDRRPATRAEEQWLSQPNPRGRKRSAKAGGGKGRGSGGGAARRGADEAFLEEAAEEMVALEAIFGAEFRRAQRDGRGFDLRVVPHPGEAEANFVAATLKLRYPNQYPSASPPSSWRRSRTCRPRRCGASPRRCTPRRRNTRATTRCAPSTSSTIAQEHLQELNTPPENSEKKSLWHEDQARSDTDAVDLQRGRPRVASCRCLTSSRRQSVEQAGVSPVMVDARLFGGHRQPTAGAAHPDSCGRRGQ
eukprot:jgi/Tetstr1/440460/TSEL_028786.t1